MGSLSIVLAVDGFLAFGFQIAIAGCVAVAMAVVGAHDNCFFKAQHAIELELCF